MKYVVKQISQERKNALRILERASWKGTRARWKVGDQTICLTAPLVSSVSPQLCSLEESLKSIHLTPCFTPLVAVHHHLFRVKVKPSVAWSGAIFGRLAY